MSAYSKEEMMESLKAIEEIKDDKIKVPLAILRKEEPELFKKAYGNSLKKTLAFKERQKKFSKSKKYKDYQKARVRALNILKKKHEDEFKLIFQEVRLSLKSENENCRIC